MNCVLTELLYHNIKSQPLLEMPWYTVGWHLFSLQSEHTGHSQPTCNQVNPSVLILFWTTLPSPFYAAIFTAICFFLCEPWPCLYQWCPQSCVISKSCRCFLTFCTLLKPFHEICPTSIGTSYTAPFLTKFVLGITKFWVHHGRMLSSQRTQPPRENGNLSYRACNAIHKLILIMKYGSKKSKENIIQGCWNVMA